MNHKKYIIISGLNLRDNNRGTAALGYGAISFLQQRENLKEGTILLNIRCYKNFLKSCNRKCKEEILSVNSITWHRKTIGIFIIEWWLLRKLGILLPWSQTAKL